MHYLRILISKCGEFISPAEWEIAVHQAVAGDVFDGVFLCCPLSHEMSWMRSGTSLSQFQRVFLPTLLFVLSFIKFHPLDP